MNAGDVTTMYIIIWVVIGVISIVLTFVAAVVIWLLDN